MPTARQFSKVFMRSVALFLFAGLLCGCSFVEQQRHKKTLDRIAKHLNDRKPKPDPAHYDINQAAFGGNTWPNPDQARAILISNLGVGLYNEFWYWDRCDRAKLRAVLDRLDANGGTDLNTVEGCLEIFEQMLQITPTAKTYGPFTYILSAQGLGTFPKPGGPVTRSP